MKKTAYKTTVQIYKFPGLMRPKRQRFANENSIPMLSGILKNCALMSLALFVVYIILSLL